MSEKKPDLDDIVSSVASSKKYRSVCTDTIHRVAEREMSNHEHVKETIKATKRRLHQVYGAFEKGGDLNEAYQDLERAYESGSEDRIKDVCRSVLSMHSSTRERLPILDRFYSSIFAITGRPKSLLDLGCGLNPLGLPWMDLVPGTRYIPLDIDKDRARFLSRFLVLAGFDPLARCQDILTHPPDDVVDMALLLKMSPSLERQEAGATLRVIEGLQASIVVVSYAVKSLGGREKGMMEQYRQQFDQLAADRWWSVEMLVFESELVFVVKRGL